MAEPIIVPSPHKIRVHPLPSGQCRLEIDATVPWDSAIDALKALGFVGKLSTEQMQAHRT
jgi:hypothetical protein